MEKQKQPTDLQILVERKRAHKQLRICDLIDIVKMEIRCIKQYCNNKNSLPQLVAGSNDRIQLLEDRIGKLNKMLFTVIDS